MSIGDDKKRFTDIYNEESDALFRFCLFRVSDREKALEITQESFTRLWVTIASGKKLENPKAVVYTVARNLIIDWYRRKKPVSLEGMSGDEDEKNFDPADESIVENMELNADTRRVLALLHMLEPHYREVIYLRFVEELPPKDIAVILKLGTNTVSVRITRGLEALRRLIGISKHFND